MSGTRARNSVSMLHRIVTAAFARNEIDVVSASTWSRSLRMFDGELKGTAAFEPGDFGFAAR